MSGETEFDSTAEFEAAVNASQSEAYRLRLYIAGATPKSLRALTQVRQVCDEYLQGRYELEVIDLYQQPTLAEGEQIIAVPTLIKKLPLPLRRIIGDLSKTERLLVGLDLHKKAPDDAESGTGE